MFPEYFLVRRASVLPAFCLLALIAGCNRGPRLMQVSGQVTYDGRPISKGRIEFVPIEGTSGPSTGGDFENGRYEVLARGPREGGVYRVVITALRKSGKTTPNIMNLNAPPIELEENFIPPEYNQQSILKVKISSRASENQFDFALQSSPALRQKGS